MWMLPWIVVIFTIIVHISPASEKFKTIFWFNILQLNKNQIKRKRYFELPVSDPAVYGGLAYSGAGTGGARGATGPPNIL